MMLCTVCKKFLQLLYSTYRLKNRTEISRLDIFSESILPYLENMLRSVYIDAPSEIQEKAIKIITLWRARSVFPEDFLSNLEQVIHIISELTVRQLKLLNQLHQWFLQR